MKFNKALIVAAAAALCASMVLTPVYAADPKTGCDAFEREGVDSNFLCGKCKDGFCGAPAGSNDTCVVYDKVTQECKNNKVECKEKHTALADKSCMLTTEFDVAKTNCTTQKATSGHIFNEQTAKCECPSGSTETKGVCSCPDGQTRNSTGVCVADAPAGKPKSGDNSTAEGTEKPFNEMKPEEKAEHLKEMKKKCEAVHKKVDTETGKCSNICLDGYATRKLTPASDICFKKFADTDKCDHKDRELITEESVKFCVCKGTKKPKNEGEDSANTECSGAAQLIMSSVVVLGSLATSLVFLL